MAKSTHPNTKRVVAYREDGSIYREFESVTEIAEYYNKRTQAIYNSTSNYHRFYDFKEPNGEVVKLRLEAKAPNYKNPKIHEKETEDQIRRRLGLNPYGEWRNDEWFAAMFERVNKKLYPNGYDAHAEWLRKRSWDKMNEKNRQAKQQPEDDELDFEL